MSLRASTRKKDGKQHRYWSIVENRRLVGGHVLRRHVLYLGEINSSQERAWRKSVKVHDTDACFTYSLRRDTLRQVRRREGRYLLRTNLTTTDPAERWRYYSQLPQVEEAFKNLKGDLSIRPIFHQLESRLETHLFIAFLAYCLHATPAQQLRPHAPGLTPRSVLDTFTAAQAQAATLV